AKITDTTTGKPIQGLTVKFYVEGKFVGTNKTDVKGISYFNYTPTKTGKIQYYVSINNESGTYPPTHSPNSTITINKDTIKLTVKTPSGNVGDKKTIKIKATDIENKVLANKFFTVYINGKKVGKYKTNSKGEITIKTTLKASNKLKITFAGDENYKSLSKTYTYTAKAKKTIIKIYKAKTLYGKTVQLKSKLTDAKGKPLAGKYVKFYVAGKYVGKVKTNKKGIAILKYTPKKKK
ncbi:hypothetical protein, partial [Methanobrevibacter filiformis]|uniref:hypothetical protein n=1 Tax=Methanobrevibacter filiformis TaxID=55758 RepID=UPI000B33F448